MLTFWPVLLDCVITYTEYVAVFMIIHFQIPRLSEFTQPFFHPAQIVLQTYFFLLRSIFISLVDTEAAEKAVLFLEVFLTHLKVNLSLERRIFCSL
jgi:hypothetical protein